MSAVKSMVRVVGEDAFSQCEAHQPLLANSREVVGHDRSAPVEDLIGTLAARSIVVTPPFEEVVSDALSVEAFPDKLIEQRRSAHGVTFGRLLKRSCIDSDNPFGRQTAINVALKPFNSLEGAVNEMRGYQILGDLGVPTFEPIGIFPAANGDHVIGITVKNNDLVSLDRGDWVVGRAVDSEKSMAKAERNNRQVKGIAETLAYIHSNGVFHPDGQIKNWVTNASDKVGVIDTEKHVVRPLGDQDSVELAWEDIDTLVKSLIMSNANQDEGKIFGVGMFANLPIQTVRNSVEELVVHPYLARLEEMLEGASSAKEAQIVALFDGLSEKFYNDETWPQHYIDANNLDR